MAAAGGILNLTTANASITGSGAGDLFNVAGDNYVHHVVVFPKGNQAETKIRVWLHDGTNTGLRLEIDMPATVVNKNCPRVEYIRTWVPDGWKLVAATTRDGDWDIMAMAGEYFPYQSETHTAELAGAKRMAAASP